MSENFCGSNFRIEQIYENLKNFLFETSLLYGIVLAIYLH